METDIIDVAPVPKFGTGALIGAFVAGLGLGGAAVYIYMNRRVEEASEEVIHSFTVSASDVQQELPMEDRELVNMPKYDIPTEEHVEDTDTYVEALENDYVPQAVAEKLEDEALEYDDIVEETYLDDEAEEILDEAEVDLALEELQREEAVEVANEEADPRRHVTNLFERSKNRARPWNMEAEEMLRVKYRMQNQAYPIHIQEYIADESEDCDQVTWTWWDGDGIMSDSQDVPVYDWHDYIQGTLEFGYGSQDANSYYIRNEEKGLEIEILRSNGRYDVEVGGLDPEDIKDV